MEKQYVRILFIVLVVMVGCAKSTVMENDGGNAAVGSDTATIAADTGTETTLIYPDTEIPSDTGQAVLPDGGDAAVDPVGWPPFDCTYRFHITEKQRDPYGGGDEWDPVDNVDDLYVVFYDGLESVEVYGPDPTTDSGELHSAKSALLLDSNDEWNEYALEDFFLTGAAFAVWRPGEDTLSARIEFWGSGVPVIAAFRGYLIAVDCG